MKLADKIIKLRKQLGWSQEELAEKLNVSRQSVSKWEGALSIPDLNRIIKLGEIFGVSTDYLIKDDIEDVMISGEDQDERLSLISLEDANAYVETTYKRSKAVAKAVVILIFSVIPLFFVLALKNGGVVEISDAFVFSIGFVAMFIMLAFGVVSLISMNQKYKLDKVVESVYFELEYGAESILKEKLESYGSTYLKSTSIGITLLLLSSLPLILSALFYAPVMIIYFMLIILLMLIGVALSIIIPSSTVNEAYKKLLHQDQYGFDKIVENKRVAGFSTFYWPLVVAIYIGWSLWTMAWGITWIIWPVAGLIFAALVGLINFIKSNK